LAARRSIWPIKTSTKLVGISLKHTVKVKVKVADTCIQALIPVIGSQPAGDIVLPGSRLPLLSARPGYSPQ